MRCTYDCGGWSIHHSVAPTEPAISNATSAPAIVTWMSPERRGHASLARVRSAQDDGRRARSSRRRARDPAASRSPPAHDREHPRQDDPANEIMRDRKRPRTSSITSCSTPCVARRWPSRWRCTHPSVRARRRGAGFRPARCASCVSAERRAAAGDGGGREIRGCPSTSQLGPKMRPSACVRSVNMRMEKMPRNPMTAMTGNSTRSPRKLHRDVEGNLELARAQRIGQAQARSRPRKTNE